MSKDFVCFTITEYQVAAELPDYTNDLNAINAAVLRLPEEKLDDWVMKIAELVEDRWIFRAVTASALERARAFVAIHEQ